VLLIVHHRGAHVASSPDRCLCAERTRLEPAGSDLAPADQHAFVSEAARTRYERELVDPKCGREHAEDVELREVARRALAESDLPVGLLAGIATASVLAADPVADTITDRLVASAIAGWSSAPLTRAGRA